MSEETQEQKAEQSRSRIPMCPWCNFQPCALGLNIVAFGQDAVAGIFFCQRCEKILAVAPLPQPDVQEQSRRVILPS